ncbi:DUF5691 domain-containing protein [Microbulbifer sp. OS29]|uniref:DUF5691 domain-containing protein n=1 Tax=Microbulbifer okhotskensis TaxID=2926617 RepID=A0A9X2EWZ2_9GAMM|nr:DUF5691 domain-containing protein [Microbulbifer okhotskensis]MCO1336858.1 DUF5691 domain-containing protein [Microbulbifer okhotskensis]
MLTTEQIREEQALLERLQQRWMVGSDLPIEPEALPASWRPLFEGLAEERLPAVAVALLSQHQCVLYQPQAPEELREYPMLPDLNMPLLPYHMRAQFRRVSASIQARAMKPAGLLLQLLLQRGYIAHPADWLPSNNDEGLPEIYLPWSQWVANEQGETGDFGALSMDNWDDWYPASRLAMLKELRFHNPTAALNLIQACAGREPAEKRLKIVQVLSIRLTEADVIYLQSLTNDRSQKIVRVASQYLARLGRSALLEKNTETAAAAQELAEFYELKTVGMVKKQLQLLPRKLKSKKQQAVRSEILQTVPLQNFAEALEITVEELAVAWQFEKNRDYDNRSLVAGAVNTLPDLAIARLVDSIETYLARNEAGISLLHTLIPRLKQSCRAELMFELLRNKKAKLDFQDLLSFLSEPLTELSWDELRKTSPWKSLMKRVAEELAENGYLQTTYLQRELSALGLMLPRETVRPLLEALFEQGVLRADPAVDCLKFNGDLEGVA